MLLEIVAITNKIIMYSLMLVDHCICIKLGLDTRTKLSSAVSMQMAVFGNNALSHSIWFEFPNAQSIENFHIVW